MNIALKKQFEDFITAEVAAGRYGSEAEVVEQALRDLMDRAEAERIWQKIEKSEQQIARGEYIVADDAFFERKRQMIRERYMKEAE